MQSHHPGWTEKNERKQFWVLNFGRRVHKQSHEEKTDRFCKTFVRFFGNQNQIQNISSKFYLAKIGLSFA